jgi:hypothetical protein
MVYLLLFYIVILLKKIEDVMKNLWGICEDKNRYDSTWYSVMVRSGPNAENFNRR